MKMSGLVKARGDAVSVPTAAVETAWVFLIKLLTIYDSGMLFDLHNPRDIYPV